MAGWKNGGCVCLVHPGAGFVEIHTDIPSQVYANVPVANTCIWCFRFVVPRCRSVFVFRASVGWFFDNSQIPSHRGSLFVCVPVYVVGVRGRGCFHPPVFAWRRVRKHGWMSAQINGDVSLGWRIDSICPSSDF